MEEMTANQVLVLMALVVRMPVQRVMDRHWENVLKVLKELGYVEVTENGLEVTEAGWKRAIIIMGGKDEHETK